MKKKIFIVLLMSIICTSLSSCVLLVPVDDCYSHPTYHHHYNSHYHNGRLYPHQQHYNSRSHVHVYCPGHYGHTHRPTAQPHQPHTHKPSGHVGGHKPTGGSKPTGRPSSGSRTGGSRTGGSRTSSGSRR